MIRVKKIESREDFESLRRGDVVACEFHRDVHDYPRKSFRFKVFTIYDVKQRTSEVILQKSNNIYFNYDLFLNPENGVSNLKSIVLIESV